MASRPDHLSPRTLFQILDGSLRHYRSNFVRFVTPFVPMAIVDVFVAILNSVSQVMSFRMAAAGDPSAPQVAIIAVTGLVFLASIARWTLYYLGYGATIFLAGADLEGKPLEPREAWELSRGRFWMLFGLTVIIGFLVTFGLILFIIPGIFAAIRLLVSPQIVVLEGLNVGDAIGRSNDLMRGSFWRGLFASLFPAILVTALTLPMTAVGLAAVFFVDEGGEVSSGFFVVLALAGLFSVLVNLVLAPLYSIIFTHFYRDVKVRKEGGDLKAKLRELGSTA